MFLRFLPCLLIFSAGLAFGQTAEDLAWARKAMLPIAKSGFDHTSTKESRKPGQKIAAGGFSFYKTCISSQDYRRCNFTMSCSEFCLRAIQSHGFVQGMLMGLDRYARCNVIHRSFYPWESARNRSIDNPK